VSLHLYCMDVNMIFSFFIHIFISVIQYRPTLHTNRTHFINGRVQVSSPWHKVHKVQYTKNVSFTTIQMQVLCRRNMLFFDLLLNNCVPHGNLMLTDRKQRHAEFVLFSTSDRNLEIGLISRVFSQRWLPVSSIIILCCCQICCQF